MASRREFSVYRNAFSKATRTPKIPDGKVTTSIGMALADTETLNWSYSDSNSTIICVYPGVNSCAKALSVTGTALTQRRLKFANHVPHEITQVTTGDTESLLIVNNSEYSKWRCVSAGLSITNIKSENGTSGWWEAIAVPIPRDEKWFCWTVDSDLNYTQYEPSSEWLKCGGGCNCIANPGSSWATNEYYRTGKLKDLNKTIFQCIPTNHDHNFTTLEDKQRVTLVTGAGQLGNPALAQGDPANLNTLCDQLGWGAQNTAIEVSETGMLAIDKMWDNNFLCWLISLHPPNGQTVEVLLEGRSNQELIANCDSVLRQFHTESHNDFGDNPSNTAEKDENNNGSNAAAIHRKRIKRSGPLDALKARGESMRDRMGPDLEEGAKEIGNQLIQDIGDLLQGAAVGALP